MVSELFNTQFTLKLARSHPEWRYSFCEALWNFFLVEWKMIVWQPDFVSILLIQYQTQCTEQWCCPVSPFLWQGASCKLVCQSIYHPYFTNLYTTFLITMRAILICTELAIRVTKGIRWKTISDQISLSVPEYRQKKTPIHHISSYDNSLDSKGLPRHLDHSSNSTGNWYASKWKNKKRQDLSEFCRFSSSSILTSEQETKLTLLSWVRRGLYRVIFQNP